MNTIDDVKLFELRDSMTMMPVMAIKATSQDEVERWLLRHAGYPLDPQTARSLPVAHGWIIDHWQELKSGDVIDVQFILDETKAPKISKRIAYVSAD